MVNKRWLSVREKKKKNQNEHPYVRADIHELL